MVCYEQLEEGQGRKESEAAVHDSQQRLEYLIGPWSAPERQVNSRPHLCLHDHVLGFRH